MSFQEGFQVKDKEVSFYVEEESKDKDISSHEGIRDQLGEIQGDQQKNKTIGKSQKTKKTKKTKKNYDGKGKKAAKDLATRLFRKNLDFLDKIKEIDCNFNFTKEKGKPITANFLKLTNLWKNPNLRPYIYIYFHSGHFRRDILIAKKRLEISDQSFTNSLRNLLENANFIEFAFIQGEIKNLNSLSKPIDSQNMIYQQSQKRIEQQISDNQDSIYLDNQVEQCSQLFISGQEI